MAELDRLRLWTNKINKEREDFDQLNFQYQLLFFVLHKQMTWCTTFDWIFFFVLTHTKYNVPLFGTSMLRINIEMKLNKYHPPPNKEGMESILSCFTSWYFQLKHPRSNSHSPNYQIIQKQRTMKQFNLMNYCFVSWTNLTK